MLVIIAMMVVIVAVAGLVLGYVAFPHRGEAMPRAPFLGEAMERVVSSAPTIRSAEELYEDDPAAEREHSVR